MDVREAIGRNVKALREELNLSQTELADKAGLSRFVIIKIENQKSVTLETVEKISHACKVDPSDLLKADGVPKSKQRHTELERNGSTINMDYYDTAFINLPEYVQQITKALSVKLTQYLAPDNLMRELNVSMESTVMKMISMMKSQTNRETVINMSGEDATDYWIGKHLDLLAPNIRSQPLSVE